MYELSSAGIDSGKDRTTLFISPRDDVFSSSCGLFISDINEANSQLYSTLSGSCAIAFS